MSKELQSDGLEYDAEDCSVCIEFFLVFSGMLLY